MSRNHHFITPLARPTTTQSFGIFSPSDANLNRVGFDGGHIEWPGYPPDPLWANVGAMQHFNDWLSVGNDTYLRDSKDASGTGPSLILNGSNLGGWGIARFGPSSGIWSWVNPLTANNGAGLAMLGSSGAPGTGDFTFECFFYCLGENARFQNLIDCRPVNVVTPGPVLVRDNNQKLGFFSTGASEDITGTNNLTANAWHHVHMTRDTGTTYLGMDGAQEGSDFADATNYTSAGFFVGTFPTGVGPGQTAYGYIAEVRATIGIARYTRTYTVPTTPFPDY